MSEVSLTSELAQRDAERLKGYHDLLDFYGGVHWEGRERWGERRLTFNYARVFVDKLTSYLMSGVTFTVEAAGDSEEARARARKAKEALDEVYETNRLEQLDLETEADCAVLGDACYKVIWDSQAKQIKVTAPDVQGIYAWWRGDDVSRIWRVASRYSLTAPEAELIYGVKPQGKTVAVVEVWTDEGFELYLGDSLLQKKPNPYGFLPFIIYPNLREPKRFWGTSDLLPITESQRELNRAMSQLSRILELSGNPIAVLENVEQSEDIAVKPGAVWNIPEDAKAYLLDLLEGGAVGLHIDYINLLYRILHDLSESPRAAFGGTERDLSGVALEMEMHPLLQKVQRKRLLRTSVYNRRNEMVLRLLEKYRGENFAGVRPQVVWAPVLPRDVSRLAANEQVLVQTGLHSRRRAMKELGVSDPEQEFKGWLEERETILRMNQELNTRPSRTGRRERASEPAEGVEE
ncbi:MAG: phage portal protein [Chloroflexota bacterium]